MFDNPKLLAGAAGDNHFIVWEHELEYDVDGNARALQWKQIAGGEVKSLRYIISSPVENDETNEVVQQALANNGKQLGQWPERVEFAATTQEGQALLASANGRRTAWMLISHKADFGLKTCGCLQFLGPWNVGHYAAARRKTGLLV
ncbi:uncharacterized protein BDZ99DRAFT_482229 [Mytilinidion resinicola]|uniref:Uncharacterized protein n=1 Tax=Mytilinidion resinicola TaxID=574789 RepID=A0A6A6Y410_9PEZI|nr:uncharacterized protein BDZ99DRAFT_482229 [Mytilinidion resinicola]KAF2803390.1 hypothetical protein BDZ99DRAFT_482229 [Mytilinidion resinicola]